jgi:hypothetical protein
MNEPGWHTLSNGPVRHASPLIRMAPGEAGGHLIGRVTRKLPMRYLALWRAEPANRPQEADEKERVRILPVMPF